MTIKEKGAMLSDVYAFRLRPGRREAIEIIKDAESLKTMDSLIELLINEHYELRSIKNRDTLK
jgi:hypothetical protein